jgi:hypothetical protein
MMRRGLAIMAGLLLGASACVAANYYRQMLMLPRAGAASSQYQTDPYAANLIARWDFDATAWTNDVTANGYNLGIDGSGTTVSNLVVGTNIYGRVEKAASFYDGQRLRRIIPQAEFPAWSNSETVVSFWIYRARTNASEYVYGFGATNAFDDGVLLSWSANSYVLNSLVRSNATSLSGDGYNPGSYTNGMWYHLVEYRSSPSTGNKYWVNGVIRAGNNSTPYRTYQYANIINRVLASGRNAGISFGDRPGSQDAFSGYVDNARIYNSGAATNNVAWLYLNTHPTNNLEAR